MILIVLALAVASQDTTPKPLPPDSYADAATAELVTRARAARERNERLVTAYTANVTQRLGVGIRAISRDRMLGKISLYWFTGAIGSSFWPYYARLHDVWPISPANPVRVPTGYAAFPKEIVRPPRAIAAKTYSNIQRWTEMKKGGHFAAMEQPVALAAEIQAFFRPLR